VSDSAAYFVVPPLPNGGYDDPDKATEVYFRNEPSGKWSGPHTIR
jgi:hypothetical protein